MRTSFLVLSTVLAAGFVAASACEEHIPTYATLTATGDAGLPPLETTPPAQIPPDMRKDSSSSPVVFDPLRGGVWTANGDVGSVSYVDIDAQKVVGEVAIGQGGAPGDIRSVALSPDFVWIAAVDRATGTVALMDAESRKVRRTLAVGSHPRAAAWDAADPRWLYVAVEDDGVVAVIDRSLGVLAKTILVGRLPSGVAVSRRRNELYVNHRIDARVTVVDLGAGQIVAEVPLADQPADPSPTVPQGKPFAFEGLAWAADGNLAWMPHEILESFHPFQFQRLVFPAISVVDLDSANDAAARGEVQSNPNAGATLGRKVLFDAINIPDATGATTVVSELCAVVLHPNAVAGYAIACGSEDLLTFDAAAGVAVDIVRNIPGDHPVGITLDDTGQRAFVVSDQSHTLDTFDVAGGSPLGHSRLIGGPLSLVAKDPLDPDLRAGKTLFFRANSQKGDLATTGNGWLSCGGCHLDGFGTTEAFLFEALHPRDPTTDAQIGHAGLADMFSTSATPGDPSFNPHDILVAFLDQGGLAPDRTGADRTNAVDPSNPTPAARTMATQIARVIGLDLPLAPSWLSSDGGPLNSTYDTQWCGNCHPNEYAAWQKSAMSHAGADSMMLYCAGLEKQARGAAFTRLCVGCHDPIGARSGDFSLASGRGITCVGCHEVTHPLEAAGNADLRAAPYDWTVDHKARATAQLPSLRSPGFCGGCHEQFVPGTGLLGIGTHAEYAAGPFAGAPGLAVDAGDGGEGGGPIDAGAPDGPEEGGTTYCVDCHMAKTNGIADHSFPGGNVYLATAFDGGAAVTGALTANLQKAIALGVTTTAAGYVVAVRNVGSGHAFPTGVTDIREPWVELQALDASKNVLARFGGPDPVTGLIPASAARLGMDVALPDGGALLLRHELSEAARIPFQRVVPPGGEVDLTLPKPASLPSGTAELDAVLLYRNVRTTYYRAALGAATGNAPEVEVARVRVSP